MLLSWELKDASCPFWCFWWSYLTKARSLTDNVNNLGRIPRHSWSCWNAAGSQWPPSESSPCSLFCQLATWFKWTPVTWLISCQTFCASKSFLNHFIVELLITRGKKRFGQFRVQTVFFNGLSKTNTAEWVAIISCHTETVWAVLQ
jgi:hypothetical protein